MHHPTFTKAFLAEAAITARRIVALGSADGAVTPGTGPGDPVIGIAAETDAPLGQTVDIHLSGTALVEAGAAIARGQPVTAMADGKATVGGVRQGFEALVTGASANTDIAVSGLALADRLVSVRALPTSGTLHQAVVDGAGANTDITVAGITDADTLVSVIELATNYADRMANTTITADNTIRISDATTGDRLLVTWRSQATGPVDRTASASARTEAGKLQFDVDTTGAMLLVAWERPANSVGIALEAATSAGELIPVLIAPAAN